MRYNDDFDKNKIQLSVRSKEKLSFPDGAVYGKLIVYDIIYDGQVIGRIEKEQYLDGTALVEGFRIIPKLRGMGLGTEILKMKEFRGSYIAPGNSRVRHLYKRLSQSSWKNFSEQEKEQWRNMYKKHRGMFRLK